MNKTKEELLEKAKTSKLNKEELRDLLIYLCEVNETDNEDKYVDLMDLDFSNYDGNVYIAHMKVKNNLFQSYQEVKGDLHQSCQKVQGDLYQNFQTIQNDLYQEYQNVKGNLWEYGLTIGGNIFDFD